MAIIQYHGKILILSCSLFTVMRFSIVSYLIVCFDRCVKFMIYLFNCVHLAKFLSCKFS